MWQSGSMVTELLAGTTKVGLQELLVLSQDDIVRTQVLANATCLRRIDVNRRCS